jgi:hypothetical protein
MNKEYLDALYKEFLNYEVFSFNAAKYSRYDKPDDEKFFYNGNSSILFTGLSINPDDVIIKPALSYVPDIRKKFTIRHKQKTSTDYLQEFTIWNNLPYLEDFPYIGIHIKTIFPKENTIVKPGDLLFTYENLKCYSQVHHAIDNSNVDIFKYDDYKIIDDFNTWLLANEHLGISSGKVDKYFQTKFDGTIPKFRNGTVDYQKLYKLWLHS